MLWRILNKILTKRLGKISLATVGVNNQLNHMQKSRFLHPHLCQNQTLGSLRHSVHLHRYQPLSRFRVRNCIQGLVQAKRQMDALWQWVSLQPVSQIHLSQKKDQLPSPCLSLSGLHKTWNFNGLLQRSHQSPSSWLFITVICLSCCDMMKPKAAQRWAATARHGGGRKTERVW